MERDPQSKIELEIADLTKQIEAKRKILEASKGIIEEKEVVRQAVGEKISENSPQFTQKSASPAKKTGGNSVSYLDSADEETSDIVNGLLGIVFSSGIEIAIKEAEKQEPYIMDAFHDALTDKLYEELRSRGIINQ